MAVVLWVMDALRFRKEGWSRFRDVDRIHEFGFLVGKGLEKVVPGSHWRSIFTHSKKGQRFFHKIFRTLPALPAFTLNGSGSTPVKAPPK